MKDPRVSIRLSNNEHEQLKILVAKRHTNINDFIVSYVRTQLDEDKRAALNRPRVGPRVLSLFANIGVAEAYFNDINVNVVLANELVQRRAELYAQIYPNTEMKCGDITNPHIQDFMIARSKELGVNLIMATPPCQGMSTAGKQEEGDIRNNLIVPVVRLVREINPKYVFIENVPLILQTRINVDDVEVLIPDYLRRELGKNYTFQMHKIDTKDYSVPQTRERAIILLTRKDMSLEWTIPAKEEQVITMRDAIGHLPPLDPFIKDVTEEELLEMFPEYETRKTAALEISKWHFPPTHIKRQVEVMMHTPTGKTAFDNPEQYRPQKTDGKAVKGFRNTYKRQDWDIPAFTVTMDNRKISSQNNVHPGRPIGTQPNGDVIYSDARALTVYELMKITSLPDNWQIPRTAPAAFLRSIIGEGIPPLFVRKAFEQLGGVEWEK
jgi:DNA (cytosine-5)-methyltransferase 1